MIILMYRLDQGQSYLPEKQTSLEDRYYNNQSFQEEFPVNDPEINHAATKIQAKFRGHKARQGVEKLKQETKQVIDTDQDELGYNREQQSATPNQDEQQQQPATPNQIEKQSSFHEDKKQSPLQSTNLETEEPKYDPYETIVDPDQQFPEELTEEEKEEQERAARSIQAKFRGFQARKSANRDQGTPEQQNQEFADDKSPTPSSTHLSGKIDSDRQDLEGNITANDQNETVEDADTDRPRLEREPTQLSEDFERHTQVPRDSDFDREPRPDFTNEDEDEDMNDPNLDKAATRIQASYRGYKTRKELVSAGSQEQQQQPTSPHTHDDDDNAQNKILSSSVEGNKEGEVEVEEDDNAAAVKIQAAYRGYKIRKDLEK